MTICLLKYDNFGGMELIDFGILEVWNWNRGVGGLRITIQILITITASQYY